MDYAIRTAGLEDISLMISWAKQEGWNPGLFDYLAYQAADPTGFFVSYFNRAPIASISAVRHSKAFGFMGFYIVKPEFRGKNFGIQIWKHAMEHLRGAPTIGLDGVVEQQHNYQKSGFQLAHRNIRFTGKAPVNSNQIELISLKKMPIEKIEQYESKLFPGSRTAYLQSWIKHANIALAFLEQDELKGYGTMRKCQEGYKIGPLFAENIDIAREIIMQLCTDIPNETISLDIPMPNQHAIILAEELKMKPAFETARMYKGEDPKLDLSRVFGITSFELG